MDKKAIASILLEADKMLDKISVKGDDVFALVNARKLMMVAFDELNKPPEEDKTEGDS